MEYRVAVAESDDDRRKEQAFTGIGLTSRKNLCIHPEVRPSLLSDRRAPPTAPAAGRQGEKGQGRRRALPRSHELRRLRARAERPGLRRDMWLSRRASSLPRARPSGWPAGLSEPRCRTSATWRPAS